MRFQYFILLFFFFYDKQQQHQRQWQQKKNAFKFYLLLTGKLDVDNVELCLVSRFYVLALVDERNDLRLSRRAWT